MERGEGTYIHSKIINELQIKLNINKTVSESCQEGYLASFRVVLAACREVQHVSRINRETNVNNDKVFDHVY